jgi:excisionase family DNA binding protein
VKTESVSEVEEAREREAVRLLTLPEVAAFLRLSPRSVRRLVGSRRLPCVRIGRVLRFHPADLFRFVEARKE